ncbi:MAG: GntR family transcriptional regulator [Clostridiales bacterium]
MLKFNDNSPIYIQIIQKIKADIISGRIKVGSKLPSVRELSFDFKVNPNTIQRVFIELDREGITFSKRGIGTFIKDDIKVLNELKKYQAEKYTKNYIHEMKELGLTKSEVFNYLNLFLEEIKNEYP